MLKRLKNLNPDLQGGLALVVAAGAALLLVNLGGAGLYERLLAYEIPLDLGNLGKSLHHWVNDGLMPLFFVLIGIEIHREFRHGELREPGQMALPFAAAAGGVLLPVLVFTALTLNYPWLLKGATVPMATDTAFALALLAALRRAVPPSIRAFVLALAVIDDLIAVGVIALFYTHDLQWMNLFLAVMMGALLVFKNKYGLRRLRYFLVGGFLMWLCVLQSGVHTSVAGVLVGLLLPLKGWEGVEAPAHKVERVLTPWVRWGVLPLFGFFNAGISLEGLGDMLRSPLVLAIVAALFVGKQAGVFGFIYGLHRLGWAKLPRQAGWRHLYGMALLCGIGFTMSLFIGNLALPPSAQAEVRLGVLAGSLVSAAAACLVLLAGRRKAAPAPR